MMAMAVLLTACTSMNKDANKAADVTTGTSQEMEVSELISKAAEGDATAQLAYGRLLKTTGNGVEQDWTKAVEMLQQAAAQGNADAQWELGLMYEYANHVDKDETRALELYRSSADQGSPIGLYLVAHCYQHGIVVDEDHAMSDSLYTRSVDELTELAGEEDIYVLNFIGSAYYWGDGVEVDRAKAFGYYLTSAQKGNPETQYKIGLCYETGQGTEANMEEALGWYRQSAAQGYPEALDAMARLDNRN